MGLPLETARAGHIIDRTCHACNIDRPANTTPHTLGHLIDDLAIQLNTNPDQPIPIHWTPCHDEIHQHAKTELYNRLQSTLPKLGGIAPDSPDSKTNPNDLLPFKNRPKLWQELQTQLDIKLERLQPFKTDRSAMAFFYIMILIYILGIWLPLFHLFGFDKGHEGMIETILQILFAIVMFIGMIALPVISLHLISKCKRNHIPFDSVKSWINDESHQLHHQIKAFLSHDTTMSVNQLVLKVAQEEIDRFAPTYNVPPETASRNTILYKRSEDS